MGGLLVPLPLIHMSLLKLCHAMLEYIHCGGGGGGGVFICPTCGVCGCVCICSTSGVCVCTFALLVVWVWVGWGCTFALPVVWGGGGGYICTTGMIEHV